MNDGGRCLNCGEALRGAFCSACGQRSVPADPTVSELAGDAWQELSGYDGRIAATCRGLLRPGHLTNEYVRGRRAKYLPPVRIYLIASLVFFVVAAAAPDSRTSGVRIVATDGSNQPLTEKDRQEIVEGLKTAPWFMRPILQSVAEDPAAFRARIFTIMPRVFFGMLPVFAAILTLLYRGRRYPVSLVFAAHVHTAAYLLFAVSTAARFAAPSCSTASSPRWSSSSSRCTRSRRCGPCLAAAGPSRWSRPRPRPCCTWRLPCRRS